MPQYLVAGYIPDDFDPSKMDEATGRKIHELNTELIAAGVRKFACGLGAAKSLRGQADGRVVVLLPSTVSFVPRSRWRSPRTGTEYPVSVQVRAGEFTLDLVPLMDDQEFDSRASTGAIY